MLIYDCEIVKAIPKRGEQLLDDIDYCEGWHDHEGMGISVIGVYDYETDRYRVFLEDNFAAFQALVDSRDVVIGFNSLAFDNRLCRANGLIVDDAKSYDLLVEIWTAAGLGPRFVPHTHGGYGLDACAQANFGTFKSGHGALAPVDWQRGNYGSVIDYCLNDVAMTKALVDQVIRGGWLRHPHDRRLSLYVRSPTMPLVQAEEGTA